MACAWTGVGSL